MLIKDYNKFSHEAHGSSGGRPESHSSGGVIFLTEQLVVCSTNLSFTKRRETANM